MKNLNQIKSIVVLTGAGISAESGIKTFRDSEGLWENHDVLSVASPQGFERDPEVVHKFYNQRRKHLQSDEVRPNQAHLDLSDLERKFKGSFHLVTQNVDNLHERAGSQNIIHMHGELLKARCQKTGQVFEHLNDIHTDTPCPCCQGPGNLRPHIVWFGEVPLSMQKIDELLTNCDLFISIGTSGQVYPAAMFIQTVKYNPYSYAIEINKEKTQVSPFFDEHIIKNASIGVKEVLKRILEN